MPQSYKGTTYAADERYGPFSLYQRSVLICQAKVGRSKLSRASRASPTSPTAIRIYPGISVKPDHLSGQNNGPNQALRPVSDQALLQEYATAADWHHARNTVRAIESGSPVNALLSFTAFAGGTQSPDLQRRQHFARGVTRTAQMVRRLLFQGSWRHYLGTGGAKLAQECTRHCRRGYS